MNTLYKLIVLVIVSIVWSSCEEDNFTTVVNIDIPEHENRLAISGNLSSFFDNFLVYVSESQSILEDADSEPKSNAIVKLYEDGVEISELSYQSRNGSYRTPMPANLKPGSSYKLEATHPVLGVASAVQQMPSMPSIKKASYTENGTISPDGSKQDEVEIVIDDNPDEENFYAVEVRSVVENNGETSYTGYYYLESFDPIVENGFQEDIIFSDASFNGNEYSMLFSTNIYLNSTEEKVMIIVKNITRDKYLFERSRAIYDEAQYNPFTEPVTVHSNIDNGYGMFTAETLLEYIIE